MGIHIDNYNERILRPLALVKAVGKSTTNTRRVDVLNSLIYKSNRLSACASSSGGHEHANSSLGQKRKLPPREEKKRDSWIKAKQKLSPAEL